jgi:hypothetical protein
MTYLVGFLVMVFSILPLIMADYIGPYSLPVRSMLLAVFGLLFIQANVLIALSSYAWWVSMGSDQ